jgi:FG-GAP-like repeat
MPTSDITNNSFATATRLTGFNNAPQGAVDQVLNRTDNALDFYRFTTSGSSNLRINLTGIAGDVQLTLYRVASDTATPTDADRVTLRPGSTGRIAESYTSTSDASLADVTPGTYYIKVEQAGIALPDSTYSLSVFASSTQDTISALWRNPNGGLDVWQLSGNTIDAKGQFSATDTPATLQFISSGDFNADGVDDLLWKDTIKNTFVLWFMENGTVRKSTAEIQDSTGLSYKRNSGWAVAGLDDIDKDGFTDILLRNQTSGEIDAWFMNQERVTKAVAITNGFRVYAEWQIAGFANSRVLWRNVNSNAVVTWDINQNGLGRSGLVPVPVNQNWQVVSFQDFNNDGVADVMWRNTQEQRIVLWRMLATDNSSSGVFDPIAEGKGYSVRNGFRISTIADFNGDKRPDVLFWDANTGEIVTWETSQNVVDNVGSYVTSRQRNNEILNIKYDGFDVALAKDFDGDQKADILWRDRSGITAFWKMNGSVVERDNALDPSPPGGVVSGIDYYGFKSVSSLKATTKKQPQFTAGTSRVNSFDLGVLDGSGSFFDRIGGPALATDRADWYRFKVEIPSLLTGLNLTGASIGTSKIDVYTDRGSLSNTAFTATELLAVLQAGTYYIRVTPDSSRLSLRTDYALNVTGRLGITNLKANRFTIGQTSLALDTDSTKNKITVTAFQFENNGDFAANNVRVGYYLSRDGVLDTALDRRLTQVSNVGTVARGIAEKVNSNGTITPGTPNVVNLTGNPIITLELPGANDSFWSQSGASYQIIAVVDPDRVVTNETKRDDNVIASTAITVTKAGGIDLTGNGFTSNNSVSKTGTVTGSFTIQNLGGVGLAAGQSLKVKLYFSKDATISASGSDLFLQEIVITSAIAAGGSLVQNFSFALPTDDDAVNYWVDNKPAGSTQLPGFIGMIIDTAGSNILDSNVGNNQNQLQDGKDRVALTITGL